MDNEKAVCESCGNTYKPDESGMVNKCFDCRYVMGRALARMRELAQEKE